MQTMKLADADVSNLIKAPEAVGHAELAANEAKVLIVTVGLPGYHVQVKPRGLELKRIRLSVLTKFAPRCTVIGSLPRPNLLFGRLLRLWCDRYSALATTSLSSTPATQPGNAAMNGSRRSGLLGSNTSIPPLILAGSAQTTKKLSKCSQ